MKIPEPFTSEQLDLIKGSYATIARNHKKSSAYVGQIANGKRSTKTKVANDILNDLKDLCDLLEIQKNKKTA